MSLFAGLVSKDTFTTFRGVKKPTEPKLSNRKEEGDALFIFVCAFKTHVCDTCLDRSIWWPPLCWQTCGRWELAWLSDSQQQKCTPQRSGIKKNSGMNDTRRKKDYGSMHREINNPSELSYVFVKLKKMQRLFHRSLMLQPDEHLSNKLFFILQVSCKYETWYFKHFQSFPTFIPLSLQGFKCGILFAPLWCVQL